MAYRIDLETLNEERLRAAVDSETFRLGQELANQGVVQVVDITDLTAYCTVLDKRTYTVQIKIANNRLLLVCNCRHAGRGLICEHDVAAWLGIRIYLEKRLPPSWRKQVDKVIDALRSDPRRRAPTPYILFFSLRNEFQNYTYLNWRIQPYQVSTRNIPEELFSADKRVDSQRLAEFMAISQEFHRTLRPCNQLLNPDGCLNCPPSSVNLANLILDRNRLNYYHSASAPIDDLLELLSNGQTPLYLASPGNPLAMRLKVSSQPGKVQIRIDQAEDGLLITPFLMVNEQQLEIDDDEIAVISSEPTWVLVKDHLFKLAQPSSLNLLHTIQEMGEVTIPAEQSDEFMDAYLLELVRQVPLEGNALRWETSGGEPQARLYLSDVNGELQAQLRFAYEGIELAYDADLPEESVQRRSEATSNSGEQNRTGGYSLVRIQRQPATEKAVYDQVGSASFGLKRAPQPSRAGNFRLRARTHAVDFLLNHLPRLAEAGFEIYGEEKLKTARVNRSTPSISFNVTSGIDWFDVKAVVNFGDLDVAFKDIRRAMRKREKYIKLADGSIGEIPEEWFDQYKHLFALGQAAEDNLRFSHHHVTLIELALAHSDRIKTDADFERQRQKIRSLAQNFQGIQPRPLPDGFTGELRPYQKAGYDWLHFLRDFSFGGCLADDMGLGKTIQALVFLQSLYGNGSQKTPAQASLLVVPRSLLVNWQREASRFTPDLKLLEYFDIDRIKDTQLFDQYHLVVTTYGVMLRDIQVLHGYNFQYAILDESQAIKNPLSQTARAAHLLQAHHRLVLTGTPIENSTSELWSQFAFLNPGLLGSLNYFKTEFGAPIEKKADENIAQTLRRIVYPFILRRTKDQVAPELPPRTERILYCDMDPAQRKLYEKTRDYYRGVVMGMMESEGLNNSRMLILEGLLRLRQISNHPLLVDEKFRGGSGKFELLLETLETLQAEDHKALIFSQFVQMLNLVRKELDGQKISYNYLDGSTINRQEQVDVFQETPEIPFFLISLKAGGLGLNLTAADYVIHIDPWWNPAVEMQASDRTHRIGQDKPVFVFKLITRDSVEEKILILQERKRNLVDQIITTEGAFFKNLTEDDIRGLFS